MAAERGMPLLEESRGFIGQAGCERQLRATGGKCHRKEDRLASAAWRGMSGKGETAG